MKTYKIMIINLVIFLTIIPYNYIKFNKLMNEKNTTCRNEKSKNQISLCVDYFPVQKRNFIFLNYKEDYKFTVQEETNLLKYYLFNKENYQLTAKEQQDLKELILKFSRQKYN